MNQSLNAHLDRYMRENIPSESLLYVQEISPYTHNVTQLKQLC